MLRGLLSAAQTVVEWTTHSRRRGSNAATPQTTDVVTAWKDGKLAFGKNLAAGLQQAAKAFKITDSPPQDSALEVDIDFGEADMGGGATSVAFSGLNSSHLACNAMITMPGSTTRIALSPSSTCLPPNSCCVASCVRVQVSCLRTTSQSSRRCASTGSSMPPPRWPASARAPWSRPW